MLDFGGRSNGYNVIPRQALSTLGSTYGSEQYRGASLIKERLPAGPYREPMPRVLGGSQRGGRFLVGKVPLYGSVQ